MLNVEKQVAAEKHIKAELSELQLPVDLNPLSMVTDFIVGNIPERLTKSLDRMERLSRAVPAMTDEMVGALGKVKVGEVVGHELSCLGDYVKGLVAKGVRDLLEHEGTIRGQLNLGHSFKEGNFKGRKKVVLRALLPLSSGELKTLQVAQDKADMQIQKIEQLLYDLAAVVNIAEAFKGAVTEVARRQLSPSRGLALTEAVSKAYRSGCRRFADAIATARVEKLTGCSLVQRMTREAETAVATFATESACERARIEGANFVAQLDMFEDLLLRTEELKPAAVSEGMIAVKLPYELKKQIRHLFDQVVPPVVREEIRGATVILQKASSSEIERQSALARLQRVSAHVDVQLEQMSKLNDAICEQYATVFGGLVKGRSGSTDIFYRSSPPPRVEVLGKMIEKSLAESLIFSIDPMILRAAGATEMIRLFRREEEAAGAEVKKMLGAWESELRMLLADKLIRVLSDTSVPFSELVDRCKSATSQALALFEEEALASRVPAVAGLDESWRILADLRSDFQQALR
jgi:hypothetical protein